MSQNYDLIVIGSGPGGYIAAIRGAQMGLKTAIVEKDKTLGGTCLNVGCIPSKAMLESSHHYYQAKNEFSEHGISVDGVSLQLDKMLERKNKVVEKLTTGVAFLMKKNKIDHFEGLGQFQSKNEVKVIPIENGKPSDGDAKVLTGKNIIIATGSTPGSLPGIEIDEKAIVSSTGALDLSEVPKKLVVVGGGYIGLEMGSVWSRLGAEVEVIEFMDRITPNMDDGICKELQRVLKKQGLKFRLNTAVKAVDVKTTKNGSTNTTVTLTVESNGKTDTVECDKVLMSVGRKPCTEGLGLENAGLSTDSRGFIEVDQNFRTKEAGIYAIGDVIGGAMLAHKAEEEGVVCVENICGEKAEVNYNLVPGILYTHPEVAATGATEQQLKSDGVNYKVGQFRFLANGRAISAGETDGFVKILADSKTDEVLGAHIISNNASEMIHELCLAMEYNATAEDIALTMHGHPTMSEAIKEAALNVHGRTLNS